MGFRSSFITTDLGPDLPPWFLEKWGNWWNFYTSRDGKRGFPISSPFERKMGQFADWHTDLQKVLREADYQHPIILAWLHECGGITRVEIHKDRILFSEPDGWTSVDYCGHSYCDGCSDHPEIVHERSVCRCGSLTHREGTCAMCGKQQETVEAK